ncbi:hypothetical protein, partial [Legionella sp.]|uniref:hypothetical protein n=1 Tax=Legionella sp. TaxID=459 RepID=UPI000CC06230
NKKLWSDKENPSWDDIDKINGTISSGPKPYRGVRYIRDFENMKSELARPDAYAKDSPFLHNLEQTAEICLRHLEILHECHQKWIPTYESREEHGDDEENYDWMIHNIKDLTKKVDKFSADLEECADYFHESSLRVPLPNDSLESSLERLGTNYQAAYQSMSSFWRWVKKLFQQGERDLEVQFLQTLSQTEGCTDSIRIRAVELVHNKIMDEYFGSSSLFGSGSRLKNILGLLAQKRVEVEMGEEDELFSFIGEHGLELPSELAAYYESVKPPVVEF